ncbi:MAG: anti-sigma factor antagonist [Coriobacteriales bacterium]|nr:anti-sigma factor antagonist [Coriobacteriales bacterium]
MAFDIDFEIGSDTCVARLAGDIDIAVVPALRADMDAALEAGCRSVVLDLSDVAYADSSALGLLVWLDHRLRPVGGRLVRAGANDDVARILELSGLVQVAASVQMSSSVASALEGLQLPELAHEPLWSKSIDMVAAVENLGSVREEVVAILGSLGFADSALFDIKVALGEALANAVRHGAPADGSGEVRVEVVAYDDRIVLEVMDNGIGFNGQHAGSDDVYAPSGRGIMFMRALMDRVEFDHSPLGGTKVRLVKHRPVAGAPR